MFLPAHEEYPADTPPQSASRERERERVWQSPFKVFDKTVDKLGGKEYEINHTRKGLGTFKREIVGDKDAIERARDTVAKCKDDSRERK